MTDEQKTKADFISGLAEVIYDYFPEIWELRYYVADGEEFVSVAYTNNSSRRICVTADSLSALLLDIGRYLCHH